MCIQSPVASASAVCAPWHFCFLNSCHVVIHSSFCFHQALVVHFEADTERRKLGLPHRVNFLGRSSLEPEYTQTEEVELRLQRTPVCTTVVFQLHVSYTFVYTEPDQKLQPELLITWTQRVINNLWFKWMERWLQSGLINFTALTCLLFCQNTIIFASCINFLIKVVTFFSPVPAGGHSGQTAPHLTGDNSHDQVCSPTQTLRGQEAGEVGACAECFPLQHAPLWGLEQRKKKKKKRILSPGLMLMG